MSFGALANIKKAAGGRALVYDAEQPGVLNVIGPLTAQERQNIEFARPVGVLIRPWKSVDAVLADLRARTDALAARWGL